MVAGGGSSIEEELWATRASKCDCSFTIALGKLPPVPEDAWVDGRPIGTDAVVYGGRTAVVRLGKFSGQRERERELGGGERRE